MIQYKKLIFGTLLTRVLVAAGSFAVVSINSKWLFAAGVGEITLFILALTLNTLVSEIVGGANLTYLASRIHLTQIILPVYLWALITSALTSFVFYWWQTHVFNHALLLWLACFMQNIINAHYHWFNGNDKVSWYNTGMLIQAVLLPVFMWMFYTNTENLEVSFFYYALCFTLLIVFVYTHFKAAIIAAKSGFNFTFNYSNLKLVVRLGLQNQIAAISQFGNYRLVYFVIERLLGKATLGVFSVGNQLAEAAWIPGKSLSTIQYAKVSNSSSDIEKRKLTKQAILWSLSAAMFGSIILLLIPDFIIEMLFGVEFLAIKSLFPYLVPGILALSISMGFSHYFSGIGLHRLNMYTSLFGVVCSAILVYPAILYFNLQGAAAVLSIVYSISTLWQGYFYVKLQPKQ